MSIWVALVLVTLCALLWDAGILLQKLAVDRMPTLRVGRGLPAALRRLLTSGRWMAGLAASAAGWGLFAWALTGTPVSVARAIQGSGFVILAVFSMIVLRHRLRAAEWLGVALVTAGVVTLGIAGGSPAAAAAPPDLRASIPGLAACAAAGAAAWSLPLVLGRRAAPVVVFSIIAGILLGLGDVCTRSVLLELAPPARAAAAGAIAVFLVAFYVTGFVVLSRAYQHGRPIVVTAVSDLCARLVAILMGVTALGERLPADPRLRVATLLAFGAVLSGAVLLARFGGEGLVSQLPGAAVRRGFGAPAPASQLPHEPPQGERPVPPQVDPHR